MATKTAPAAPKKAAQKTPMIPATTAKTTTRSKAAAPEAKVTANGKTLKKTGKK